MIYIHYITQGDPNPLPPFIWGLDLSTSDQRKKSQK